MTGLTTSYEFTLPRGYVDKEGQVHRVGTMRLATARDELDPLRDPTVSGPEDPRLTILVLARVVERLGDRPLVTTHEIEGLFAVDLAYLQDFYGVINFGTQDEYDELVRSQQQTVLLGDASSPPTPVRADEPSPDSADGGSARPSMRAAVEEIRRQTS